MSFAIPSNRGAGFFHYPTPASEFFSSLGSRAAPSSPPSPALLSFTSHVLISWKDTASFGNKAAERRLPDGGICYLKRVLYARGVCPCRRRNSFVKWLWSVKPKSFAISASVLLE